MADIVGTKQAGGKPNRRPKPVGHWAKGAMPEYNPEAQEAQRDLVRTEEYVKRYALRRKSIEGVVPTVDATMQIPSTFREDGKWRYRLRPVVIRGGVPQFADFVEGATMKWALEAHGNPFDFDTGGPNQFSGSSMATSLIDQNEFIPFLQGPFYKQLYQYDYLSMHARAFELVNHSALAAGAVKILTRFVVGRGISFTIKDEECSKVWEEFWERNKMREQVRQMARDVTWQGELMMEYTEPVDGYLGFRVLDPSSCWEIVTDPENFNHVYYYHFQWPTPYQIWVQGNIPVSKYIIKQVPPTQIQHVKINVSSQEKRGRSDLLPAMPWLKRFNDFYNGIVIKAMLEANLVYIVKVHGDQADVDAIANDPNFTILPPPGGMWLENEAVELKPTSASLTATRGAQGIGQQLANIIFASLNLPSEYANIEGSAAARATALVRTDPAVKTVEDRQQYLKEVLEDTYDRVMEAALRAGRISKDRVRRDEPEVADADEQPEGPQQAVLAPDDADAETPTRSAHARPVRATVALGRRPTRAVLVRG